MHARRLATIGCLGLLAACGGRPLDRQMSLHPANVVPEGASQVFYANVDALRENALAALAFEKTAKVEWGQSFRGIAQILRLAGDVARLTVGTYGSANRTPSAVAVATGRLDAEAFAKGLKSAGIPQVSGTYGEWRIYTCGEGEARCYVSFASPSVVVAASQEGLLKRTLDLSRRKGKSMARDPGFQPLLETFSSEHDLWATGAFPAALAGILTGPQAAAIQMIQAFTIGLGGGQTTQLNLVLHCGVPEATPVNAEILETLLGQLTTEAFYAGYEIQQLLDAVKRSEIQVGVTTVDFRISMSKAEIDATAEAFRAEPKPRKIEPVVPPFGPLP